MNHFLFISVALSSLMSVYAEPPFQAGPFAQFLSPVSNLGQPAAPSSIWDIITRSKPDNIRASDDVALVWNRVHRAVVLNNRVNPPIASHNFALMHMAMYQAYQAGKDTPSAKNNAAVAAYSVLRSVYNTSSPGYKSALATANIVQTDLDWYSGSGVQIAMSLVTQRNNVNVQTGSFSSNYTAHTDGPSWRPLPGQTALLPNWGKTAPFVIGSVDPYTAAPIALTDPAFIAAYQEIYQYGGQNSPLKTQETMNIALFWNDGPPTPPGHWMEIADVLISSSRRKVSTQDQLVLFYALSAAMANAAISCWKSKFTYDWLRPVTAITMDYPIDRSIFVKDPTWAPIIPTPPFPEYTSGHSSFSGAAGTILTQYFGDVAFTNTHQTSSGPMTRSFSSITSAVQEAGKSRIYGGIHFQTANTEGILRGGQIGQAVLNALKNDQTAKKSLNL